MRRDCVGYREDAGAEDDHVDIYGLHIVGVLGGDLVEGAEADEIVLFEEFDFFARFLRDDIFGRQSMDAEGALEDLELFFCGIVNIKPPDTAAVGGKSKQLARTFSRSEKASKIGGMNSLLKLGAEEAVASMFCKGWTAVDRPFLAQYIHIDVIDSIFVVYLDGARALRLGLD